MRRVEGVQPFFSQEEANIEWMEGSTGVDWGVCLGQPVLVASNQRWSWRTLDVLAVLAVLGHGLMSGIRRFSLLSRSA